ncbi:hypothetical protein HDV05_008700, partial [Chytridiales sp. JEL 0842]
PHILSINSALRRLFESSASLGLEKSKMDFFLSTGTDMVGMEVFGLLGVDLL